MDRAERIESLSETLVRFTSPNSEWEPDLSPLNKFSAKTSAEKLINAIERI